MLQLFELFPSVALRGAGAFTQRGDGEVTVIEVSESSGDLSPHDPDLAGSPLLTHGQRLLKLWKKAFSDLKHFATRLSNVPHGLNIGLPCK